jgi:hypothetical protein
MSGLATRSAKRRKLSADEAAQPNSSPTVNPKPGTSKRSQPPTGNGSWRVALPPKGKLSQQKVISSPPSSDAENITPESRDEQDINSISSDDHVIPTPRRNGTLFPSRNIGDKSKDDTVSTPRASRQRRSGTTEEHSSKGTQPQPIPRQTPTKRTTQNGKSTGNTGSSPVGGSQNLRRKRHTGKLGAEPIGERHSVSESSVGEIIAVRDPTRDKTRTPDLDATPTRSSKKIRPSSNRETGFENVESTLPRSTVRGKGLPRELSKKATESGEASYDAPDMPEGDLEPHQPAEDSIWEFNGSPGRSNPPNSGSKGRRLPTQDNQLVAPETVLQADNTSNTRNQLKQLMSVLKDKKAAKTFAALKDQIVAGLSSRARLPLVDLDEEYEKLHQLVQQTIVAGEGNSMLIIGSRGTGKTALVETLMSQMVEDHGEDFYVVRLNGFIHTDDKLALKDIWRQLGKEMSADEEFINSPSNYADTLTSLLALLSHPTEHSSGTADSSQTSRSVVFIIDEFDLFTTHSRQTLLYNLFDIAQSRKAPIAVLGLTTKVNVVESLEKRVKSRFSHRYIYLSLPKSFKVFQEICSSALLCELSRPTPADIHSNARSTDLDELPHFAKVVAAWSNYITAILTEDRTVSHLMRRIYAHTKSVPDALAMFLIPIILMSPTNIPSAADFASNTLLPPDSKLHLLQGLSELELALLISAARLDIILDTDTCNFNMAYDEYTNLTSKAKLQSSASGAVALGGTARVWSREVALGAWERLEVLEFLVPGFGVGGMGRTTDVGRAGRLWKVDVGLEEIAGWKPDMSTVTLKWCKEI